MARTCPDGHVSRSEDYCDVCGVVLTPDSVAATPEPDATAPDLTPVGGSAQDCPNCAATNPDDALFCEACGYDYTTGTMPRPLEPLLVLPTDVSAQGSVQEPVQESADAAAPDGPSGSPDSHSGGTVAAESTSPALDEPWVAEVWIDPDWYHDQGSADPMPSPGLPTVVGLRHTSSLIGRSSRSRGIAPEVDIAGDPGVSRRHAQLTTDGARWFVEDLGSANGTYVGAATAGLPSGPIPGGQKREIAAGEQIYLGAWTRIVVREAAEGEV